MTTVELLAWIQKHLAWIVAVASLAVAIFALRRSYATSVRKLGYEIETNAKLIKSQLPNDDGLQISYQGKPVTDLRLYEILIFNYGLVPIEPKDIQDPITISLDGPAKILRFENDLSNPLLVKVDLECTDDHTLLIHKTLLNPNDVIRIVIIAENSSPSHPSVKCRITGVREPVHTMNPSHQNSQNVAFKYGFILAIFSIPMLLLSSTKTKPSKEFIIILSIYVAITFILNILFTRMAFRMMKYHYKFLMKQLADRE